MTVAIHTRGREVRFDGKTSDIAAAQVAMNNIVKNMKDSYIEMSFHLISVMNRITMITHMVDVFKRKDICAVYATVGHTTLGVFALSNEQIRRAIEVIRSETVEIYVDVEATLSPLLNTPQWAALKDQHQVRHGGLLVITEAINRVTVSGEVNSVAQVKDEIQRLLVENTGDSSGNTTGWSYVLGGIRVEAVQGDLTRFPVDAIVNAANEKLDHCAGLAKAIVDAGIVHLFRNTVTFYASVIVKLSDSKS